MGHASATPGSAGTQASDLYAVRLGYGFPNHERREEAAECIIGTAQSRAILRAPNACEPGGVWHFLRQLSTPQPTTLGQIIIIIDSPSCSRSLQLGNTASSRRLQPGASLCGPHVLLVRNSRSRNCTLISFRFYDLRRNAWNHLVSSGHREWWSVRYKVGFLV